MTQKALADAIGVAQGTISKLENGHTAVEPGISEALARALDYTPSFFFEDTRVVDLPAVFFRKRKSLASLDVKALRAQMNVLRMQAEKLARSVELPDCHVPTVDLENEPRFTPQQVARDLRSQWGVPTGPIENLTHLLERAGVVVIRTQFPSMKADGVSVRPVTSDIAMPIVFLNAAIPADRARFTLAHELAHLIFHHHQSLPCAACEDEADAFASEFLMPASNIRSQLGNVTLAELASLKKRWGVSMAALLRRASDLERIRPWRAKQLHIEMSQNGYRKNEPVELPSEEPTVIKTMVRVHLEDLGYSESELADVLRTTPEGVRLGLLGERPRLRVLRTVS
jgi:Zn-dependent peptidase ImmA (M78 family)/plasmid maintenance system antidote protein VapI